MMISTRQEDVISTANQLRPKLTDELKLTARPILQYLVSEYDVSIMTYKQAMQGHGIGLFKLREITGSKDAVTYYDKATGKYTLLYNSEIGSKERKVWTLYHEAGHIIRGHAEIINADPSMADNIGLFEWEANTFAREIIAPTTLVYGAVSKFKAKYVTRQDLYFMYRNAFGLSRSAAGISSEQAFANTRKFDVSLLNYYRPKISKLFPFIHSTRDYELILLSMTKSDYDYYKGSHDLRGSFSSLDLFDFR